MWVEHSMGRIRHSLVRTLTAGLLVSVLIFLMPHLFGEGYMYLKTLLTGHSSELFNGTLFEGLVQNNGSFIILFFLLLVVFKVVAKEGDKVNAGDAIIILEAMKMENAVGSPVDGTITEIKFKEGDQVAGGDVLAIIE